MPSKIISRKLYKKVESMYSLRYETKKYRYRIDYWGDILRQPINSQYDMWDCFRWDEKSDNWKLVENY